MPAGIEIKTTLHREAAGAEVPVVTVQGEIDLHTCPHLRDTLEGLTDAGAADIVVDMAGVEFIDTAGLGVLVGAVKMARENGGGGLCLVQVAPSVRRALEITSLIRIFRLHHSVEVALAEIAARNAAPLS